MSKAKFTKGKWVADIRVGCCAVYPASSRGELEQGLSNDERNLFYAHYKNVAMYPKYSYQSEESIANAHLIAAAPEMYEMLDYLHQQLSGVEETLCWNEVGELLAKARGEQ